MQLQRQLTEAEALVDTARMDSSAAGGVGTGGMVMLREEVTEADIADIISKWTGIPVGRAPSQPTPAGPLIGRHRIY